MITTYATVLVPDELLGRVTSAAMTLSSEVMPVASLGAGYLLTGVGPIGSVTTVMLIAAIASSVSPDVRHAPPLPSHDVGLTRRTRLLALRQAFAAAHEGADPLDPHFVATLDTHPFCPIDGRGRTARLRPQDAR
ncbi:hypothetical protein ACIHAR_27870 [Streptomyces sp. NPDC052016]|uniref:hypothetical protein n=1 Tax=Streptomyces sp. NPDC052016 TaxID=3365680 RepID=UPI0037D608C6